jgi:uncharacterized protein (DUF1800 family)
MTNGRRIVLTSLISLCLAACGGGGGGSSGGGTTPPPPAPVALTSNDVSRFLTQATYGPTDLDISTVKTLGYSAWIDQQMGVQQASAQTWMDNRLTALIAANPTARLGSMEFEEAVWQGAATGQDQLRERVKLALSEIFVVSFQFSDVDARGAGSYWDMLGNDAFVNFRTLLNDVTYHPQMGRYLTYIHNLKENPTTGQTPDENYAREVMQLMTIGLWQLNQDGTQKLDAGGKPIPTYTHDDISGLAKVFTGLGFYSPTPTSTTFYGGNKDANAEVKAMIAYEAFHSTSQKDFLGVTIPASTTAATNADVKTALDAIFNHPNVGPFIGKRLIQSLVTSNPSPGYVSRVAGVFNNNGSGVRGDMAAVIKAVLTDTEARDSATAASSASSGKLREPMGRLANWMRVFGAKSTSGNWLLGTLSNASQLNQSALNAPSVFNFWRPGYVPTNSKMGSAGLLAPEFQVVDEVSVSGYLNTIQTAIQSGIGSSSDIKSTYDNELGLAATPQALVDRLNLLLCYGQMSTALQAKIVAAVGAITIPSGATVTQAQITATQTQRVQLAVLMTMASGDYLAQR